MFIIYLGTYNKSHLSNTCIYTNVLHYMSFSNELNLLSLTSIGYIKTKYYFPKQSRLGKVVNTKRVACRIKYNMPEAIIILSCFSRILQIIHHHHRHILTKILYCKNLFFVISLLYKIFLWRIWFERLICINICTNKT